MLNLPLRLRPYEESGVSLRAVKGVKVSLPFVLALNLIYYLYRQMNSSTISLTIKVWLNLPGSVPHFNKLSKKHGESS